VQEDDEGNEQPIYYVSRTLKDTETREDRKSMSSDYLCIPKAKTVLFNPSDPPGD